MEEKKKKNFLKIFWNWLRKISLKYRKFFLIFWTVVGFVFAVVLFKNCFMEWVQYCIFEIKNNENSKKDLRLYYTIFITVTALPVSFYLWFLRNHDKLEQLEKAKENNNFNNFSNAMKLFAEKDNLEANCIGLKLLAELRRKGLYVEQIDLATAYKNLLGSKGEGAKLQGADLKVLNLQEADLRGANLRGASLQGTNLEKANLQGVDLTGAKLEGANLERANLERANLERANLNGAELKWAYLQVGRKKANNTFTEERLLQFLKNGDYNEYDENNRKVNYGCITVRIIKNNDTYTFQEIKK